MSAVSDADKWEPDLHWLTDALAVGACFPMERARDLVRFHEVRAVVDLRGEAPDNEERLRAAGIARLHLPTPDTEPAAFDDVERGVRFVTECLGRDEKVLIHCQHGIGRSAMLALCVMVDQGWEPLQALAHAKDRRAAVSPSRSQYEGWAEWLARRGKRVPSYHEFGCIAYRHLAQR